MTQEEKELLLIDICGRLPYKTYIEIVDKDGNIYDEVELDLHHINTARYDESTFIRPYLRPLSSMEKSEIADAIKYIFGTDKVVYRNGFYAVKNKMRIKVDDIQIKLGYYGINNIDWLNKYNFDYRGLIPMGLALEAPEDMYKN